MYNKLLLTVINQLFYQILNLILTIFFTFLKNKSPANLQSWTEIFLELVIGITGKIFCLQVFFLLQLWSCNICENMYLWPAHSWMKLFVILVLEFKTQGLFILYPLRGSVPFYWTLVKANHLAEENIILLKYHFPILQWIASEPKLHNVSIRIICKI